MSRKRNKGTRGGQQPHSIPGFQVRCDMCIRWHSYRSCSLLFFKTYSDSPRLARRELKDIANHHGVMQQLQCGGDPIHAALWE